MQTYNSFNELASANSTPAVSQMSVFNATPEQEQAFGILFHKHMPIKYKANSIADERLENLQKAVQLKQEVAQFMDTLLESNPNDPMLSEVGEVHDTLARAIKSLSKSIAVPN